MPYVIEETLDQPDGFRELAAPTVVLPRAAVVFPGLYRTARHAYRAKLPRNRSGQAGGYGNLGRAYFRGEANRRCFRRKIVDPSANSFARRPRGRAGGGRPG